MIQVAGSKPTAPQPLFTLCGGVRLFHSAKARLEQCTACNNDVTLTVSASASAVVRKCRLTCGNEGFALLRAGTHFTCFASTKVQILPPEVRRAQCYASLEAALSSLYLLCLYESTHFTWFTVLCQSRSRLVLTVLALLVRKYSLYLVYSAMPVYKPPCAPRQPNRRCVKLHIRAR